MQAPASSVVKNNTGILRKVIAEAIGTALLLTAVVGSGIMGERLAGGNVAIALLANSLATGAVPAAVGLYIMAAYWFTSSTSFANPAVTLARSLTDTFTGIRPQEIPGFIMAQFAGAFSAMLLCRFLFSSKNGSKKST